MLENKCRGKPCVCPHSKTENDPMSETIHLISVIGMIPDVVRRANTRFAPTFVLQHRLDFDC